MGEKKVWVKKVWVKKSMGERFVKSMGEKKYG